MYDWKYRTPLRLNDLIFEIDNRTEDMMEENLQHHTFFNPFIEWPFSLIFVHYMKNRYIITQRNNIENIRIERATHVLTRKWLRYKKKKERCIQAPSVFLSRACEKQRKSLFAVISYYCYIAFSTHSRPLFSYFYDNKSIFINKNQKPIFFI